MKTRLYKQHRRALVRAIGSALAGLCLFSGCIYDSGKRCGDKLVFDGDACVCPEGTKYSEDGCVSCGENEEPGDSTGCKCIEGYSRGESGECENLPDGMLDPCTKDSDCPVDGANHCAIEEAQGAGGAGGASGREGYCTIKTCDSHLDCPPAYGCELDAKITYCVPPPTGLGTSCSEHSDCGDFEAQYCESLQQNACLQECTNSPGVCQGDWACCDFSPLITHALCIPPDELPDGKCPLGGTLLEESK